MSNTRVFLPLKKDIMFWLKEFINYGLESKFNEQVTKCKSMLSEDFTKPVGDYDTQKECYDDYYMNGFSTIEIAKLFEVSKQYVDSMLAYKYDTQLRENNVDKREQVSKNFNNILYVIIPEQHTFNKLKEFGIKSTEYTLREKYRKLGGNKITTLKEEKERDMLILARKIYDDYSNGMGQEPLTEKYGLGKKTIVKYIGVITQMEESNK